jgi:DNA-binding LacI/PurR family transcriptional regulator
VWSISRYRGAQEALAAVSPEIGPDAACRLYARKSTAPLGQADPETQKAMDEFARILVDRAQHGNISFQMFMVESNIWQGFDYEKTGIALQPIFEKALADPSITAWITENDSTALLASKFLSSKGVVVPKDISLAGFDNLAFSYQFNITSYNFLISGIVQKAVYFILNPLHLSPRKRTRIECPGTVVERGSTGRRFAMRELCDLNCD